MGNNEKYSTLANHFFFDNVKEIRQFPLVKSHAVSLIDSWRKRTFVMNGVMNTVSRLL